MNIVESLRKIENQLYTEKDVYLDLVGSYLTEDIDKSKLEQMIINNDLDGVVELLECNESFEDMESAYDEFDEKTAFADGRVTSKPSKEIRKKQARRNELRNKQFSDGLSDEEKLELNGLTKELLARYELGEALTSDVTTEDIIDWMYEHDQATDDCLNHFNVDDLYSIETEALMGWISDHDTLASDFENHFGISLDEWQSDFDFDDVDHLDLRLTTDDMNAGQWHESLNEELGQDYSALPEIKQLNYRQNGSAHRMPGIDNIRAFIKALENVGEDRFKIRTTRMPLSNGDIRDEWLGLMNRGWRVYRDWDTSMSGFNEVYVCEKIK